VFALSPTNAKLARNHTSIGVTGVRQLVPNMLMIIILVNIRIMVKGTVRDVLSRVLV